MITSFGIHVYSCIRTYMHAFMHASTEFVQAVKVQASASMQYMLSGCTYTHIYIHRHINIHTYIHTYTHAYIHSYTHMHTQIHTYIHTYTKLQESTILNMQHYQLFERRRLSSQIRKYPCLSKLSCQHSSRRELL